MPYAIHTDVSALLPRVAAAGFGVTDKPSLAQVTAWAEEVSARVDGRIRAASYDPATVSASGTLILKSLVAGYVAGKVARVWAGVTDRGGGAEGTGADLQAPLLDLWKSLHESPAKAALELGIAPPAGGTPGTLLASFHTDSADRDDLAIVPDRQFKVGGLT